MRSDEKNEIKPWLEEEWCIPKADAEFVAKMEDVLGVYERPYDPVATLVCVCVYQGIFSGRSVPAFPAF